MVSRFMRIFCSSFFLTSIRKMSNGKDKPGNTSGTTPEVTSTTAEAIEEAFMSMVEAWNERQAENRGLYHFAVHDDGSICFQGQL